MHDKAMWKTLLHIFKIYYKLQEKYTTLIKPKMVYTFDETTRKKYSMSSDYIFGREKTILPLLLWHEKYNPLLMNYCYDILKMGNRYEFALLHSHWDVLDKVTVSEG